MRHKEPLGEEQPSDSAGTYQLTYAPPKLEGPESGGTNLSVEACDRSGRVLAASRIIFGAEPEEPVDLVIPAASGAPSEYERVLLALEPRLGHLQLSELTDQDIDFLPGDTGVERRRIARLVASTRLADEAARPKQKPSKPKAKARDSAKANLQSVLTAKVFFAWLSGALPADTHALWSRPANDLMSALDAAIAGGVVPQKLRERRDEIAEEVKDRTLSKALEPAPKGAPPTIGDILRAMPEPLGDAAQRRVAEILRDATARDGELGERLRHAGLKRAQADSVVLTLTSSAITTTLAVGDRVQLKGRKGEWHQASVGFAAGWIHGK